MNGQVGDVLAINGYLPRRRPFDADNHVESRRLAGAIRSQEADDLALVDADTDTVDGISFFIRFYEIFSLNKHRYPLRLRITARYDDDSRPAAGLDRIIGQADIDIVAVEGIAVLSGIDIPRQVNDAVILTRRLGVDGLIGIGDEVFRRRFDMCLNQASM